MITCAVFTFKAGTVSQVEKLFFTELSSSAIEITETLTATALYATILACGKIHNVDRSFCSQGHQGRRRWPQALLTG